jgi:hypothetical protein
VAECARLESVYRETYRGFKSLILRQSRSPGICRGFFFFQERWRWDLNPRWSCPHTRFRGVLLRPLGHTTVANDTGRWVSGSKPGLLPLSAEELREQEPTFTLANACDDLGTVIEAPVA